MVGARSELLRDLLDDIGSLANSISAPARLVPVAGESDGADDLWVAIEGSDQRPLFTLYYTERGSRRLLAQSPDRDTLIESVMDSVTFSMACDLERRQRRSGEEFRIQMFEIQEDLTGRLNPEWAERMRLRHARLLAL